MAYGFLLCETSIGPFNISKKLNHIRCLSKMSSGVMNAELFLCWMMDPHDQSCDGQSRSNHNQKVSVNLEKTIFSGENFQNHAQEVYFGPFLCQTEFGLPWHGSFYP